MTGKLHPQPGDVYVWEIAGSKMISCELFLVVRFEGDLVFGFRKYWTSEWVLECWIPRTSFLENSNSTRWGYVRVRESP